MYRALEKIDAKELQLPETLLIRDIETKVFQSIVLQVLSGIEGVETVEGNLFDTLLGDGVRGIHVSQDQQNHSVSIRVEVNVAYGVSLPKKAEEIQLHVVKEVSQLTSLHVSSMHVIFKNLISKKSSVL